jgi:hypothetical protein
MIVAWHEVPGKRPPRELSRRVRYDPFEFRHSRHRIGAHACTNQTVPYATALLGGPLPGTSCQARREQAIASRMATIAPSLRDKSHSPSRASD